jgi:hypothetical protein
MNTESDRPTLPASRRLWWRPAVAVALLVAAVAWLVQGPLTRFAVEKLVTWWGVQNGCEIRMGEVRGDLFRPLVIEGLELMTDDGTGLTIEEVRIFRAGPSRWSAGPFPLVRGVALRGVSGTLVVTRQADAVAVEAAPVSGWVGGSWPAFIEVGGADVQIVGREWSVDLRGAEVLLDEGQPGFVRTKAAEVQVGVWRKQFTDLQAVAVWQGGTVYLADLALAENVTVDTLSWRPTGEPAATLEARAFGGYIYADWSHSAAADTKAAWHALNLSLEEAREFAGVDGAARGTLGVAKLTFNGDPSRPWAGQLSVRLEAEDFAWRETEFAELTLGLSVAGRRVRINEAVLRQKANTLKLRGTGTLPVDRAAWREAPFDFEVSADVRELRALTRLLGPPWDGLSGGFTLEGRGAGRAADGEGWLKLRGWDLRARGVPSVSLQADLKMEGRDLKLVSLDAQSGVNFARGYGRLSLDEALTYQGRLELRVREVARYLEPLGRFAPDWAREGGVLLFWDGDGSAKSHSGVATLELVKFSGELNPVPVNAKLAASYSPGNIYVSRFLLDRGALSLSSTLYFGRKGLSVQGLQLFDGRTRLLHGELFLPLSLEAVLARRPWRETILEGGGVYAFLRSDDLDLGSLVQLFGQDTTLRGRVDVRLDAQGAWGEVEVDGRMAVAGLRAAFPALRIPDSRANVNFQLKNRRASVAASLQPGNGSPLRLQLAVPVFGETAAGGWTLFDEGAPWEAELEIPPTEVAAFAPRVAGLRMAAGSMRVALKASETLARPHLDGTVEWRNGRLEFPAGWQAMEDIEAQVLFAGTQAVLEETRGRMGAGTVEVAGRADFSDHRDVGWEVLLRGEDARVYENDDLRLQGAVDLVARGNNQGGVVEGTFGLDGGAVRRGMEIIPQLGAASGADDEAGGAPWRVTSEPLSAWQLNVRMRAEEPLPVGREGEGGLLRPELSLRGTLGEPLLLGTVRVERLTVGFPVRGRLDLSGAVHFTRVKPWMPVLDLTGRGEAGPYDLRAGAFGPMGERRLLLLSQPPLKSEQIVLLLTAGVVPVPLAADFTLLTPEAKMQAQPSWWDLEKIRGLLGWGRRVTDAETEEWSLGGEVLSYDWAWR